MPAFGMKTDGVPGRINETSVFIKKKGIYYGQCSELCGVNHAFMPIVIQSTSARMFYQMLIYIFWNE
jgi:cytochrome c oxidase subunit 2